mgnify:FL=1
MTNLSELLPAGASGKKATFTASGTISSGDTVILNANGTVSVVAAIAQSVGSATAFDSNTAYYFDAVYDTNENKVVVSYADTGNSYYLTVVVGTVSGTSISFGTATVCYSYAVNHTSIAFNSTTNAVAVAFVATGLAGNWGRHAIGTVSGTTFTLGGTGDFYGAYAREPEIAYDSGSNKWVVVVTGVANANYLYVYTASTHTTTSISWHGAVNVNAAASYYPSILYSSEVDRVLIFYSDGGNSYYGTCRVGEINGPGTGYNWGSEVVFASATAYYTEIAFDPVTTQVILCFRNSSNNYYPAVKMGTVSGSGTSSTVSFGSLAEVTDRGYGAQPPGVCYDTVNRKVVMTTRDTSTGKPYMYIGTVSGTSLSFGSGTELSTQSVQGSAFNYGVVVYDPDEAKVVSIVSFSSGTTGGHGFVIQLPSSNALPGPAFLGIAEEAISDSATGEITLLGGVSEKLSSLTIGSTYYVQSDGSISTTSTSITAGVAISATTILLNG